ncbi:MAG: iron(III) transport system ATP-binding protein [Chloroflexi bacterium]|nr:MAG: iron(III) transport system ATP-binding protein [Chloroflexota bacterium]
MSSVALSVSDLFKLFTTDQGGVKAVQGINFNVESGDFFTLLGPSGCGKSTTLRCIAGLERPDGGDIVIEDTVVVSADRKFFMPTHKRPIGMVFQSYAIWPHMNVFDNVAFPLTQGSVRLPKSQVRDRVLEALQLVRLEGLEKRPAPQLSGGQQQRLALARALVREPKALLLDEPLSNLDAKLRDEMRIELKLLTQRLNITTIFVTHDQLEALTLSDQIAIMQEGHIIQLGTPQDIYSAPASKFAAEFIGNTNMFEGKVTSSSADGLQVNVGVANLDCSSLHTFAVGDAVAVAVRPENCRVTVDQPANVDGNVLEGQVETVVFLGDALDCRIRVGDYLVRSHLHPSSSVQAGDTVYLAMLTSDCRVLPFDSVAVTPQVARVTA